MPLRWFFVRCLFSLAVNYLPGQFLLLTVEIDGQTHSRAYSLSSSLPVLQIWLSAANGSVMVWFPTGCWIISTPGDTLTAQAPTGTFFLPADYSAPKFCCAAPAAGSHR